MTLYRHVSASENDDITQAQLKDYIKTKLVEEGLGIYDATHEELDLLTVHPRSSGYIFSDMISRRAQIGWSTHGHSAVDVNIYGSPGSEVLRGNQENTDIGKFLAQYLDLDVSAITKKLLVTASKFEETSQLPTENYHEGL